MNLRYFAIYLDPDSFRDQSPTPHSEFGYRTTYVGNYLTRRLRVPRQKSTQVHAVYVLGQPAANKEPWLYDASLIVPVAIDLQEPTTLQERSERYLSYFEAALVRIDGGYDVPADLMREHIADFRRGGYVNRWCFLQKTFRAEKLKASLDCDLDVERFQLTLTVQHDGQTVFSQVILTTRPDELLFHYRFKTLTLENETLVVKNQSGAVLTSVPLKPLLTPGN